MNYILLIALILALGGCASDQVGTVKIPVKKIEIVDIPPSFLDCRKPDLPDPKTLTNKQISSLLFRYEREIDNCLGNEKYIREYMTKLKAELKRIQG
jgi:hypothetical protein